MLFWSQWDSYTALYQNGRRTETGWQYDAAGNVLADPDVLYQWDAAGRSTRTQQNGGTMTNQRGYDGDGQVVRSIQHDTAYPQPMEHTYFIRSSVLGGRVLSEVGPTGQKATTYVYLNGEVLAKQEPNQVVWEHVNPVTGSRGASTREGYYGAEAEYDAAGVNVGFSDPFEPLQPGPEPGLGEIGGGATLLGGEGIPSGRCALDGIAIACGWAMEMLESGAAQQCPNNDCGPRTVYNEQGQGQLRFFHAFGDGYSGFMPAGAVYQGNGYWNYGRASRPPSLQPARGNPQPGNLDPFGVGYEEGGGWLSKSPFLSLPFAGKPQNPSPPPPTDCQRFADRVAEIASRHNGVRGFVDELARTFIGVASSDIDVMRQNANNSTGEYFSSTGFRDGLFDNIRDNQARHFMGGLIAGYNLGSTVGALVMNFNEDSQADLRVNEISIPLGANLTNPRPARRERIRMRGDVFYNDIPAQSGFNALADSIRNQVCTR